MDLLIAATAHAHSARLYTSNVSNFAGADKPDRDSARLTTGVKRAA
jgi:predicted nucleic acid-binding protein